MIQETYAYEWSLRDEILRVSHAWPVMLLFCLVGSLVGLVFSIFIPSPHRATKELYVGLNVYLATEDQNASDFAGVKFSDTNDYKNWQMANLNGLIFMDTIMDETLNRLRQIDPYWLSIDHNVLAGMLHAYWRNAGKWRLVAENSEPRYATEAVLTWEDVVVDRVHEAVYESQKIMILNTQLNALSIDQTKVISQAAEVTQIRDSLISWRSDAVQRDSKISLQEIDRKFIFHLIDQAETSSPGERLLADFPQPEATIQEYIDYLDRTLPLINELLLISQRQITTIEDKKNEIAEVYAASSSKSLGLSAGLKVDKITTVQPEHSVVQPTGLLVLIGGILGLLTWIVLSLIRISLQARK